jgi:capsular polysaccharide transport system permease protein
MVKVKEQETVMVKVEEPKQFSSLKPVDAGSNSKLQKIAFPPSYSVDAIVGGWKSKLQIGGIGSFIVLVLLPTVLASVYYLFIASDQYISEAKFIVRSSEKQQVTGLGALLQTTGIGSAQEETSSVLDYMSSRDALKVLDSKVDYRAIMNRDGVDALSKFPNFMDGDTFEGMYDHYLRHVSALMDSSSGVSELTVKAFLPEDAQKVASVLLDEGERLVNRMSDRARDDSLDLARKEVQIAEKRVLENQLQMKAFRVREGIVDPEVASEQALELIAELKGQKAKLETELGLLRTVTPDSVKNKTIGQQIAALDAQLAAEQGKLVGEKGSLVGTYADYEKMALEAEFSAKALLTAQANLANARVEAGRKSLYLERVVEPNSPDYARYPKRLLSILTVFMTCFLIYAIIWLLYVNAREHKHS